MGISKERVRSLGWDRGLGGAGVSERQGSGRGRGREGTKGISI